MPPSFFALSFGAPPSLLLRSGVYVLQMPLTLLVLFERNVGAYVCAWLFAAAERKYIACVCVAIRRDIIDALTAHIRHLLESVGFEPKCIPCHWSPEHISKRLRRLLVKNFIIDDVHFLPIYVSSDERDRLVERWYEAMLRLQSLCVRRGQTKQTVLFYLRIGCA